MLVLCCVLQLKLIFQDYFESMETTPKSVEWSQHSMLVRLTWVIPVCLVIVDYLLCFRMMNTPTASIRTPFVVCWRVIWESYQIRFLLIDSTTIGWTPLGRRSKIVYPLSLCIVEEARFASCLVITGMKVIPSLKPEHCTLSFRLEIGSSMSLELCQPAVLYVGSMADSFCSLLCFPSRWASMLWVNDMGGW